MSAEYGESKKGYSVTTGPKGTPLRKGPGIANDLIKTLPAGKKYSASQKQPCPTIIGVYWYYIDSEKGWVSADEVATDGIVYTKKVYTVTLDDKNNVPVYSDKSKDSTVLKFFQKGSKVVADDIIGDWYYFDDIDGKGTHAYINKNAVDKVSSGSSSRTDVSKSWNKEKVEKKEKEEEDFRSDYLKDTIKGPLSSFLTSGKDNANGKEVDIEKWINSGKTKAEKKKRAETVKENLEKLNTEIWMKKYGEDIEKNASNVNSILSHNITGIFGAPYQFSEDIDPKIEEKSIYGRTYADKIMATMPLLLITPGKADFMSHYKSEGGIIELKKLMGITETDTNDANEQFTIDELNNTDVADMINSGKYYTFAFDSEHYFEYVNAMCWSGAMFLDIDKVKVNVGGKTKKLGGLNWRDAVSEEFKGFMTSMDTIAFYVDSASTVEEDFSNTTTESQLASKVNQFADIGREIQFLLGTSVGKPPEWMQQQSLDDTIQEINTLTKQYADDNQLIKDVANNFATVATGGKLLFPEIWADSEYTKSYNINIKLRTPDNDVLSWYMNIYVPLCHLVALAAPRQVAEAKSNGYMSPFLVRAYYKGLFNCDCGIVTNLNISRGKEGSWTLNGLPTEVDISMQIKDLYNIMMITPATVNSKWFMSNTALLDYIANNCGININEPDLVRQIKMYHLIKSGSAKLLPSRVWNKIHDNIANKTNAIYNKIWDIIP